MAAPRRHWPYLDHAGPIAVAHRGGAGDWPENTLSAFEHAVGLGYHYVETDVHVTADGVLVAFHDDSLDRVTDRSGRIADLPWAEVRRALVRPPPGSAAAPAAIPLLEELLGAWPELRVNIDAKTDATLAPLVRALERTRAMDRTCVAAFSDRRLARIRRLTRHRLCTAIGPVNIARLRLASRGVPVGPIDAGCAQVPTRAWGQVLVDARFIAAAHRRALKVHVWTIDDAAEMRRLLDLGVDGIMTDRPAVLKAVLAARGQWA